MAKTKPTTKPPTEKLNDVFKLPNVTFGVQPRTKIAGCCDAKSTRYSFGSVAIVPSDRPEHVLLAATDGRKLAVVECVGQATERMEFIPVEHVPKPLVGSHLQPAAVVYQSPTKPQTGGNYITDKGGKDAGRNRLMNIEPMRKSSKMVDGIPVDVVEPNRNRFPQIADILPNPDDLKTCIIVRIDAEFLKELADALNGTDTYHQSALTLIIPADGEGMIVVNGTAGIGAVMPMCMDGNMETPSREQEIETTTKRIKTAKKMFGKTPQ